MSEDGAAPVPPSAPVFLEEVDIKSVDKALAGMIMSIRILDVRIAASAMTGAQVIEEVAEMFPPADLFGPDIRAYPIVYNSLREWLASKGASLPRHRSGREIMQLSNLYADAEMKTAAEELATRIYNAGKRVAPDESEHATSAESRHAGGDTFAPHKIAHQMSMRFKDKATKFSGELGECWMDFVAEYQQSLAIMDSPPHRRSSIFTTYCAATPSGFTSTESTTACRSIPRPFG